MDPQPDAQPSKPTGIPRVSRLPMPKSSNPNLRASASSVARPTNASTQRAKAAAATKPRPPLLSTQTNNRTPLHLRTTSTASTASNDGAFKKPATRPLSRANLQAQAKARQTSVASSKASTVDDDLGSLNSFRSDATYSTTATSPAATPMTPTFRKASRPSLSERTIETLANIPPSPATGRRQSNFFNQESPMAPRSRPASSMGSSSRPNSQDGNLAANLAGTPRPRPLGTKPSLTSMRSTPGRTAPGSAKTLRARSPTKSSMLKDVSTPSTVKGTRAPVRQTKTVAGRVQQPRGSVANLFGGDIKKPSPAPKPVARPAPKKAPPMTAAQEDGNPSPKAQQAAKSSQSLRDQIRAAKAARLSSNKQEQEQVPDFDPSQFADPFNTKKDDRSPLRIQVDGARSDGRLNISAMGLKDIPEEVLKMYDYEYNKDTDVAWNEVVDLTRFIAADNDIESIPDAVFPDGSNEDDEPKFGGLEILDLHGNVLFDVPRGLKMLECLTSLNLSRNRLMNDSLETISQITSLRELKIADNLLSGELSFIDNLKNLEVLDVQSNKLSMLPDEIRDLVKLRCLNVSNNQLTDLPMIELSGLPLVELYASKNRLSGNLFTTAGALMSRLQNLDVSVNQLEGLYGGSAGPEFPSLRLLNVSFNAITALPDISTWTSLSTILAEDNKITVLPEGFTDSISIRTADFTGNDMNKLDERVALMDGLENFKIAANPLRERKFLTMGTGDLKKALLERLGPAGFVE